MKVFCPNCGSDNEGMPGGRVTCKACTASFEVPRQDAPSTGTTGGPSSAPFPTSMPANPPTSQPWPGTGSAPSGGPSSGQTGGGWVGGGAPQSQPISTFANPSSSMPVVNNTLAIVSLVLGILCCVPFAGIGAIVTGVIARNQIAASGGQQKGAELAMVGIVLGALGIALGLFGFIAGAIGK